MRESRANGGWLDVNRGYCGSTVDHCDLKNGCQSGFGNCTGTKTKRGESSVLLY